MGSMIGRTLTGLAGAPAIGAADRRDVRRAALWTLFAAKLVAAWGVRWDIEWHLRIGRDSFWIPPHLVTYGGVALITLVSFGVLAWETWRGPGGGKTLRILGLRGTPGFQVAAWGVAVTVAAAPIDDLWHRLFGLDTTLWSPPHLLGFLGGAINSVGCLLIAREVYPPGHPARLAALTLAAALLYRGLHTTLEPGLLVAYQHGGVRFHSYPMLAPLFLPLALVSATRLSGLRAAPLLVLGVVLLADLAGNQIAKAGFALVKPVSVIEAAIAADPDSPIALAHAIARKNGTGPPVPGGLALALTLVPGLVMTAGDARRHPVLATAAYAAALFAVSGALLARSPAFEPMVPGAGATLVALGITLGAGVIGGLAARRLADALGAAAA
jgi:hypothetical protein